MKLKKPYASEMLMKNSKIKKRKGKKPKQKKSNGLFVLKVGTMRKIYYWEKKSEKMTSIEVK